MISNSVPYRRVTIYKLSILLSVFPFIPFLGGKHNYLHAKSRQKSGKYFNHIINKGIMPTLAGNQHLSVPFFFHGLPLFHLRRKKRAQSVKNGHQIG